jgi:MtrB/PioB family decaheme-associated outer membrane protein
MELRSEVLKGRRTILLAGTILVATAVVSGALAADVPLVAKSVPEAMDWYFYGGLEAGGRFVVDRPPSGFGFTDASSGGACTVHGIIPGNPPIPAITKCFLTASQTESRAKFEEYGQVPSLPFLDWINLQAGTKDGRYAFDFWGRSVGLNNQSYYLDAAQIGQHYVSVGFDQTPHLISTSAKTVFFGVGSTFLTVDPALPLAIQPFIAAAAGNNPAGDAARAGIQNAINNAEHPLELETRRDKAIAAYRWTPTPDWDFSVDYSNEHRTGVRPTGIPYGWGTTPNPRPTNPVEVPQPLDDTTQNVDAKLEYAGTTFWGMRWNTNVKYAGSFYNNDLKQLDVQNPFCTPAKCDVVPPNVAGQFFAPNLLRLGLYPDNNANAVVWNTAADLPFFKTRYVSTLQFNDMRQNDAFIDTGTNGLVAPPVLLNGVPVGSLHGVVDTLLWNNVLTSQLTQDLKFTARGRHYDVDNDTPSLHINNWIFGDSGCAAGPPNPDGTCPIPGAPSGATGSPRNSLPISYTKDNASAELTWRAARWASIGGGYFWERWDRKFRDVNVTNENMGKVWIDLTPTEIVHARASYLYGERRYDKYDTELFVEEPGLLFSEVASNMRRFDVANRNRHKADFQLDFTPGTLFTISPNVGIRWDDYPDPVFNPLGVRSDHSWNAGVEFAAAPYDGLRFTVAYNFEDRRLHQAGGSGGANLVSTPPNVQTDCSTNTTPTGPNPDAVIGTLCTWLNDMHQNYNTFMFAADVKVIPNKFDVRLEAILTRGQEANHLTPCSAPATIAGGPGNSCNGLQTGADPASLNFGQFPTEHNNFVRASIITMYHVDPVLTRQMGFVNDVTIKARYTFERNHVANWAIDNLTPYVATSDSPGIIGGNDNELTGGSRSLFLAAFNPNYTAQVVALSAVLKW